MECRNHPDREAVTNCSVCGKPICKECTLEIGGKDYCDNCATELILSAEATRQAPQNNIVTPALSPEETPVTVPEESKQSSKVIPPNKDFEESSEQKHLDIYNDERMYEDINREETSIPQTTGDPAIEEKYEKYLDDLYYDEKEKTIAKDTDSQPSLDQQLAEYEKEHGQITEVPPREKEVKVQKPKNQYYVKSTANPYANKKLNTGNRVNRSPLQSRQFNDLEEDSNYQPISLHKIHYEKEEEQQSKTVTFILVAIFIV
ncbi:MAG: hypothetical protein LBR24_01675, partial [Methanobrevibacter sp.]|nr:hypothetical protein [Methanobrevibacter sp.]